MQGRGQSGDCPEIMGTRWGWQQRALWREWVLRLEEMVSSVMARASWKGEISYFPRQSWRQARRASNPLFFVLQNKHPCESPIVRSSRQYTTLPLFSPGGGWWAPTVHTRFCLCAFAPVVLPPGMLHPWLIYLARPVCFSLRGIPWQSFSNCLFQKYRPSYFNNDFLKSELHLSHRKNE